MTGTIAQNSRFLWVIIAYALIVTVWNLDYNSPYHDEAVNIRMGRQVLNGEACPSCAQNTGTVLVQPIMAAMGDAAGGIYGARAIGIIFGLGLTVAVDRISRVLLSEWHAFLATMLFVFSGNVLYLFKLATYDIVAAFFLGLSFMLILKAEKAGARSAALLLLAGSVSLFLAAATKYTASVFILPIALFALLRQKPSRSLPFFILPLVVCVAAYWYLALYPVSETVTGSVKGVYQESHVPLHTLASWTLRWVAMPYLLAVFGMFHSEKWREALLLTVMSLPVILLHLVTGAEQSVNKNVIFALVFLSPAAAVGIDHMGNLFTRNMPNGWVKPLFTFLLMLVIWAFGLQDLRWLERQYPDISQVVSFFREKGHDNMTVVIDSDYGDSAYAYLLGRDMQGVKFIPISVYEKETIRNPNLAPPDFFMLDDYYKKNSLREKAIDSIRSGGYTLVREFRIKLSWGEKNVGIFARR